MKNYIFILLKQGIVSKKFIFSIILAVFLLCFGIIEELSNYNEYGIYLTPFEAFMNGYEGSKTMILVAPTLICTIPFAYRYAEEHKSGFEKNVVLKIGYRKYYKAIMISNGIISFLSMFIGLSLYYILSHIIFSGNVTMEHLETYSREIFGGLINISPNIYIFAIILHSSFFALVYGVLGMAFTFFVKIKNAGVLFPFLFYTVGSLVSLHFGITKIEPKATFSLTLVSNNSPIYIYGSLLLILILSVFLSHFKFNRDLENNEEF